MSFMSVNQRMRSEGGFTLVELVAVLVIIAVLAAIAVPLYRDHRERMRRQEGVAAAHTILTAAKTYYYRNNNSFTNSNCACGAGNCDDIWLNTADICAHWDPITYTVDDADQVTIRVDGTGDYSGLWVELVFVASDGSITITDDSSSSS